MNAKEIRALINNNGAYRFRPNNEAEQIASARLDMLNEIAAQLAEANQIARLRLAIAYQDSPTRMPDNLHAEIKAIMCGAEIREEGEAEK